MALSNLSEILAMAPPPPGTQANPTGEMIKMVIMLVGFVAMMYFLMIRPQTKRAKQQAEMLKSVKSGDKILTTGGIIGVVITVKEKSISLRSADAKMEITKSAVAEILERAGASSSES